MPHHKTFLAVPLPNLSEWKENCKVVWHARGLKNKALTVKHISELPPQDTIFAHGTSWSNKGMHPSWYIYIDCANPYCRSRPCASRAKNMEELGLHHILVLRSVHNCHMEFWSHLGRPGVHFPRDHSNHLLRILVDRYCGGSLWSHRHELPHWVPPVDTDVMGHAWRVLPCGYSCLYGADVAGHFELGKLFTVLWSGIYAHADAI